MNIQCWRYIKLCSTSIAYRSFVSWCWGFLGRRVRAVLPACVVLRIHSEFPDAEGQYVGFRPVLGWTLTHNWLGRPGVCFVGSIVLSGEVFRDYEFQHLVHIWGRVPENLLDDQVQQCITAVSSAINKNSCLEENCSRTKKPCAAVLQSFSYFSLLLLIYTFSSFIIYFLKKNLVNKFRFYLLVFVFNRLCDACVSIFISIYEVQIKDCKTYRMSPLSSLVWGSSGPLECRGHSWLLCMSLWWHQPFSME